MVVHIVDIHQELQVVTVVQVVGLVDIMITQEHFMVEVEPQVKETEEVILLKHITREVEEVQVLKELIQHQLQMEVQEDS